MLQEFERVSGAAVAYDAYDDPNRIPSLMREAYDVVAIPGPQLAGATAGTELRKLERGSIPNARLVGLQISAKLRAYDASGSYAIAWGWSATGLVYNAGPVLGLLGGVPNSWAYALAPETIGKLAPCGLGLPDSRDAMFIAAWRLMGLDPSRVRERDVKAAADLIIRARAAARLPVSPDPIAAIAGGAVCVTLGGAAQAEIASRRSREGGSGLDIRYADPKEGGPLKLLVLAEPRNAPHPSEANRLIDYLLQPSVASEAAAAMGLTSAEVDAPAEGVRSLWPVGVYAPVIEGIVEKEWTRVTTPQQAKAKQQAKPPQKPTGKPSRKKR
jgi:putrescine transport system substrate-binding protein